MLRLTVVSHMAKQNRMRDTTVCYIHERSILNQIVEMGGMAFFKNGTVFRKIPWYD